MAGRRRARETALQILYNLDISGRRIEDAIRSHIEAASSRAGEDDYCTMVVRGVAENLRPIDGLIERSSENWTIERMPVVDRNILRIAVFEICFCEGVPYKVAIDEAVELAKRYGSVESGPFINGILDRVRKDCRPDKEAAGAP